MLFKGINPLDPLALIDITFLVTALELEVLVLGLLGLLDWRGLWESGGGVHVVPVEGVLVLVGVVAVESVDPGHVEGGSLEARLLPRVTLKAFLLVGIPRATGVRRLSVASERPFMALLILVGADVALHLEAVDHILLGGVQPGIDRLLDSLKLVDPTLLDLILG